MKRLCFDCRWWIVVLVWLGLSDVAQAGFKIYFIRHAEAGHNVVHEWKEKPKAQWPAYVGNPNMLTPLGQTQVVKATEKLKQYHFDFIAVSPVWRVQQTILPYLKETGQKAEIWPELEEIDPFSTNLTSGIVLPPPRPDLFSGRAITVPDNEKAVFTLREDGRQLFKLSKEPLQFAADATSAAQKTLSRARARVGGSDKAILLAGHGNSGRLLLHVLLKNSDAWKTPLTNTGIWMAEEQADGTFRLEMLNDIPVPPGTAKRP
jgi:broad specificity phosphatase PhoE